MQRVDVGGQKSFEVVPHGNFTRLASFLTEPQAVVISGFADVGSRKSRDSSNAGGSLDQDAVEGLGVDAGQQSASLLDGNLRRLAFDDLISLAAGKPETQPATHPP